MRCAKCRHVWRALPDSGNQPPAAPSLLEPEAFRFAFSREDHIVQVPVNPSPSPSRRNRITAGIFVLAALAALAGYLWRRPLTELFSPTATVYQKADRIPARTGSPLKITGLVWGYQESDRRPSVRLYGEITNPTGETLPIPPLKVSLYDRSKKQIRSLTVIPTEKTIAPESQIRFQTVFTAPETPVRRIYAVFEE